MSLYGIGSFAGGLAGGVVMGQRLHYDMQRQKREAEQYQRDEGWRREAGNTLGNVGATREDGSTYTEEDAYGDLSRLGAQYNPEKAMQARATGLQQKVAKTQLRGLERTERYQQREEDVMTFLRRISVLPDEQKFREAAKFASNFGDDGKSFAIDFDANAGYSAMLIEDGQVIGRKPIGSWQEVEQELMSYASPQMHQRAQEMGVKNRQLAQGDRKLGQMDQRLGILSRQVEQQGQLMKDQGAAYRALAEQREATGLNKMPEADKIFLQGIERQKQNLQTLIAKNEDPAQAPALQKEFRRLLSQEYDLLSKHKLLPAGATKTAYLGLPDPLQVASAAMTGARNEQEFRQSMEQFDLLYGDAPEASEARNAMQVFMQNQFYSRVQNQNILGTGSEINLDAYKAGQAARQGAGMVYDFARQYHPYIRGAQLVPGLIRDNAPSFVRGLTQRNDANSR